jgi:hypothetical protein
MTTSTIYSGLPSYGMNYYSALDFFVKLKNPNKYRIIIAGEDTSGSTLYQVVKFNKKSSIAMYTPKALSVYESLILSRSTEKLPNSQVLEFFTNIERFIKITSLPVKASDTKSLMKFDTIRSHEETLKLVTRFLDKLDYNNTSYPKEFLDQLCEEFCHMDDETIRLLFKWTEVSKGKGSDSDALEIIEKLIPKFEMLQFVVKRSSSSPRTVSSASSVQLESSDTTDLDEDELLAFPYPKDTALRSYHDAEYLMKFILENVDGDASSMSHDELSDLFQECCNMTGEEVMELVNGFDEVVIDFTKL